MLIFISDDDDDDNFYNVLKKHCIIIFVISKIKVNAGNKEKMLVDKYKKKMSRVHKTISSLFH